MADPAPYIQPLQTPRVGIVCEVQDPEFPRLDDIPFSTDPIPLHGLDTLLYGVENVSSDAPLPPDFSKFQFLDEAIDSLNAEVPALDAYDTPSDIRLDALPNSQSPMHRLVATIATELDFADNGYSVVAAGSFSVDTFDIGVLFRGAEDFLFYTPNANRVYKMKGAVDKSGIDLCSVEPGIGKIPRKGVTYAELDNNTLLVVPFDVPQPTLRYHIDSPNIHTTLKGRWDFDGVTLRTKFTAQRPTEFTPETRSIVLDIGYARMNSTSESAVLAPRKQDSAPTDGIYQ